MADPNGNEDKQDDDSASPEEKLRKVLEARWDPSKLSTLMRAQEGGSRGQRLDLSQRSRFERRLGVDLGDVRIFSGELAEEITKAHNAEALTIGNTGMILMRGSADYSMLGAKGTALLAHELTHVAQAKPSAIARKAVTAELAEESESEAEAERHEAAVLHEEAGGEKHETDKSEKAEKRKQELLQKVLKLYEEDVLAATMRIGSHYDPKL
ncbi:MAG TPA: DUF4157 domain-containing protein [Haliangiales bacterium]|nr:DUF4157 domain-containing protein [Haliangiales bacterium]